MSRQVTETINPALIDDEQRYKISGGILVNNHKGNTT